MKTLLRLVSVLAFTPFDTAPASTNCTFGWSPGTDFPGAAVFRATGIYFPGNGRFYVMGGREGSVSNDFTHPFEYNPNTNTWVTKAATYPDAQVSNMACGVLTVSGTQQIYCVGGNAGGATTAASRVFSYNPITDTITNLSALDNWPGNIGGGTVPGGFAVNRNKLYLFGGYHLNVGMTAQTWQFDPTAAAGSRWLQRLNYPVARSFVPAVSIGNFIYTGGGDDYDSVNNVLTDTADSFKYDPVGNTWTAIANIPRPVGLTRAVVVNSEMWVPGGGQLSGTPIATSDEVDIYNPGTNSWRLGPPLLVRRVDSPTDGNGHYVWVSGGFKTTEIYDVQALAEKFDLVTPPALPAGWTATNGQGPGPLWVTSNVNSDSNPNDAFVDDPPVISDKYLETPFLLITSATPMLSFAHLYNLENGFDGGVLEISSPNINAGVYTDVTDPAVGGRFIAGGYNNVIDTGQGNPLAGRSAWTGNSVSHVITRVNLGANLVGQTIKLRFRMGSDISSSGGGWWIDSVWVTDVACAPTLTVTTTADHDDGSCDTADCSLRDAIVVANVRPGNLINFAPGVTGTIQLSSPLPPLNNNIALQGPGADLLTVRRNTGGAYRIFTVNPQVAVSLNDLTISNGDANGSTPNLGGAIYNDHGTVALSNCMISGNAAYSGGGIFNQGSGAGLAILAINDSTLNTNTASGGLGEGGAIYNGGTSSGMALVGLTNSTISGNTAVISGAGIMNFGASGTSQVRLINCTFNGNTISNDSATVLLANTLLTAAAGGNLTNSNGTIISLGHNLSSDAAGGGAGTAPGGLLNHVGDLRNTNPLLDPAGLADNGGRTKTIALTVGSPAINAGDNALAPKIDQREYLRVAASDIGAFEFGGQLLKITAITRLANGHIVLQGIGVASALHTVERSLNTPAPANFDPFASTAADGSGLIQFEDSSASALTNGFYLLAYP